MKIFVVNRLKEGVKNLFDLMYHQGAQRVLPVGFPLLVLFDGSAIYASNSVVLIQVFNIRCTSFAES